jgi:hypothetical protein
MRVTNALIEMRLSDEGLTSGAIGLWVGVADTEDRDIPTTGAGCGDTFDSVMRTLDTSRDGQTMSVALPQTKDAHAILKLDTTGECMFVTGGNVYSNVAIIAPKSARIAITAIGSAAAVQSIIAYTQP